MSENDELSTAYLTAKLREQAEYFEHPPTDNDFLLYAVAFRAAADRLEAAEAEVQRLSGAFEVVNDSHKWLMREKERLTAENEALRRDADRWKTAKSSIDAAEELYASLLSGRDPDADIDALAQAEKGGGNG